MSAAGARGGRGSAIWVGIGVAVVATVVLAGRPEDSGRPLDPRSTSPSGARALMLLYEELGADVDIRRGPPHDDDDVAVVLDDRLAEPDRQATADWVSAGGVLVVSDPGSVLFGPTDTGCPPALAGVERVERGSFDGAVGDPCGDGEAIGVLAVDGGVVVSIDAFEAFTNEHLGDDDNAVLAVGAAAPAQGRRIAILDAPLGTGGESIVDLVPRNVTQGVLQLGVAFAALVAWRSRRLGRPVTEPQPVAVEGSELVHATGRLLDARRKPDEAVATLRASTLRQLATNLGLPADAPIADVATVVSARTGLDAAMVADALAGRSVTSDEDLLAVAAALDRVRAAAR